MTGRPARWMATLLAAVAAGGCSSGAGGGPSPEAVGRYIASIQLTRTEVDRSAVGPQGQRDFPEILYHYFHLRNVRMASAGSGKYAGTGEDRDGRLFQITAATKAAGGLDFSVTGEQGAITTGATGPGPNFDQRHPWVMLSLCGVNLGMFGFFVLWALTGLFGLRPRRPNEPRGLLWLILLLDMPWVIFHAFRFMDQAGVP